MTRPAYTPTIAPMLASELDDAWFARVRYALAAGGHRIGAGADGSIKVSNRYGEFQPLLLPSGGIHFASVAEASKVIDALGIPIVNI
jgi:hypothetical protein